MGTTASDWLVLEFVVVDGRSAFCQIYFQFTVKQAIYVAEITWLYQVFQKFDRLSVYFGAKITRLIRK